MRKLKQVPCSGCGKIGVAAKGLCASCYKKKQRSTPEGKLKMLQYNKSERGKAAQERFRATDKYKESQKRSLEKLRGFRPPRPRTPSISNGEIHIKRVNKTGKCILFNFPEFNDVESFSHTYDGEKLIIKRRGIDYAGKVLKPVKMLNATHLNISSPIPLGTYKIDTDESNVDQLVIYYEDKIS